MQQVRTFIFSLFAMIFVVALLAAMYIPVRMSADQTAQATNEAYLAAARAASIQSTALPTATPLPLVVNFDFDRQVSASVPVTAELVKPADRERKWQTARCNNGDPFAFSVALSGTGSRDWVIMLDGDQFCSGPGECTFQENTALGIGLPDGEIYNAPMTGILSPDPQLNPTFADANRVLAHYCSNDLWVGASTVPQSWMAGDVPQEWYVSGKINVTTMLATLNEQYNLTDDAVDRVLFGGVSVGAIGAALNIDQLSTVIPQAVNDNRVKLLVDGGWISGEAIGEASEDGLGTARALRKLNQGEIFWRSNFSEQCEQALFFEAVGQIEFPMFYFGSGRVLEPDSSLCVFATTWYPVMTQLEDFPQFPIFVQQSLLDPHYMRWFEMIDINDPENADKQALWLDIVWETMRPVPWLFASDESYPPLSLDNNDMYYGDGETTFYAMLTTFWNDEANRQRLTIETLNN